MLYSAPYPCLRKPESATLVPSISPSIFVLTTHSISSARWERFSLDEVLLVFCVLNTLFFAALMLRLAFKREWTFTLALTLTAVWLIGGASLGVKAFQALHDSRAVIVARAAAVLAGPDPQDTVLFELHAGTVVESERREEGWTLIRFSTDKRGWVESTHLAPIRPRGAEDAPASIPQGQGSGPG